MQSSFGIIVLYQDCRVLSISFKNKSFFLIVMIEKELYEPNNKSNNLKQETNYVLIDLETKDEKTFKGVPYTIELEEYYNTNWR